MVNGRSRAAAIAIAASAAPSTLHGKSVFALAGTRSGHTATGANLCSIAVCPFHQPAPADHGGGADQHQHAHMFLAGDVQISKEIGPAAQGPQGRCDLMSEHAAAAVSLRNWNGCTTSG
jgi:hypothetical protein